MRESTRTTSVFVHSSPFTPHQLASFSFRAAVDGLHLIGLTTIDALQQCSFSSTFSLVHGYYTTSTLLRLPESGEIAKALGMRRAGLALTERYFMTVEAGRLRAPVCTVS